VPEQIEATPPYQRLAGVAHDLAYLLAMTGSITMDLAMLAGWFRLQRTTLSTFDGIAQKVRTGGTVTVPCGTGKTHINDLRFLRRMMIGAINTGKQCKHTQVFGLFIHRSK